MYHKIKILNRWLLIRYIFVSKKSEFLFVKFGRKIPELRIYFEILMTVHEISVQFY